MQTVLADSTRYMIKTDFKLPNSTRNNRLALPEAGYRPLRIKVFMVDPMKGHNCTNEGDKHVNIFGNTMSCTANDVLTEEKKKILEHTILPEAVKLHSGRLYVKPSQYRVVAPNFNDNNPCGELNIPEEHHTEGVDDVDMVLYATAAPTADGAFAWAATCAVHPNGRPLIGVINYSPRHIARTSQAVRVAAHEIAHTLGFNVETMHKEAKKNGKGGVTAKIARKKKVFVFDAAKIKLWGSYHYKCKNFYGMEMEDSMTWTADGQPAEVPQNSAFNLLSTLSNGRTEIESLDESKWKKRGSKWAEWELSTKFGVSSHWKRLVAKDELMAGLVGAGYYTGLTLSAFADLGYYQVDWAKAEPMSWGKGAECEFLQKRKCAEDGASKYPSMFCEKPDDAMLRCTSDRQALGKCATKEYENLPDIYSYFKTPRDGGKILGGRREDMMDYCPIIVASKGYSCVDGNQNNMPGSLVGENSRCVKGNDLTVLGNEVGDVCVHVTCKERSVYVQYAGAPTYSLCPEGGFLKVDGKFNGNGNITCPRYEDVCTTMLPPETEGSAAQFVFDVSAVRISMAGERDIEDPMPAKQEENQPQVAQATQSNDVTVANTDATVANTDATVDNTNVPSRTGDPETAQPQQATANQVTGNSADNTNDATDREVLSSVTSSSVSPREAVTGESENNSALTTSASHHQATSPTVRAATETSPTSNSNSDTTPSASVEGQETVTAHSTNLDLKLNADGGAAASALMPFVLAVVAASAIMAH
ncbi:putative surface protease GP63, putative,metallopeptidase [Trypanosoma grayi]|uniref:putative surface protease GP63, putative,metallopeptidase n=1 Tax=Trypanosoma grayi TaxID=71804 RepID=UPI0004F405EF|nr:putative surface protease GP63, putative,metallopeptidase [Trypanosoma grayi]KEG06833.1 putative surface protease GP63, putative,metallopeptidase [Trypanosoma grayi]